MGLDINIYTNNPDAIMEDYLLHRHLFGLSRGFCDTMQTASEDDSEMLQIAIITNIDISPLLRMADYTDEETLELFLSGEELEHTIAAQKLAVAGNLDLVLRLVDDLIAKLAMIENLHTLLQTDSVWYFSDFNKPNKGHYIENNFGQDLCNLQRFLLFAKSKKANSVWFEFE